MLNPFFQPLYNTVLNESEQARKRRQKLAKVTETVAAYHLREMKDGFNPRWRQESFFNNLAVRYWNLNSICVQFEYQCPK